ncbi:hypothetical protein [Treponema phagedenis]|uniref:hypothetical protein n=1 Tax=Treponema phagedenis TaxID=162 RepID=UPI0016533727|nr:hypothetical protein [Treponema phagedenis]
MGIQPIDLQTLYSQMEKVGRAQEAQNQALNAIAEQQQQHNKLDAEKTTYYSTGSSGGG